MIKFLLNDKLHESWHDSGNSNLFLAIKNAQNLAKIYQNLEVTVKDNGVIIYKVLICNGKFYSEGDLKLLE